MKIKSYIQFASDHAWFFLAAIFVVTLPFVYGITHLSVNVSSDDLMAKEDPLYKFNEKTSETFGSSNITVAYVRDGELFTHEKLTKLKKVSDELKTLEFVRKVESLFNTKNFKNVNGTLSTKPFLSTVPTDQSELDQIREDALTSPLVFRNLISESGEALALNIYIDSDFEAKNFDREVKTTIAGILSSYSEEFDQIYQIGMPYVRSELSRDVMQDLFFLLPISLLVLVCVLVVFLGSFQAAFLPLVTSSLSIVWLLGFQGFAGIPLNMLTGIIPVMLVVIGATEDMHILSEYLDGVQEHGNRVEGVKYLGKSLGFAVILTFLTTVLGFASIYLNKVEILQQFGLAASFGLFSNFLITISFNPAFLSLFGNETSGSVGFLSALEDLIDSLSEFFKTVTTRYPTLILLVFGSILLIGSLGIFYIQVNNNVMSYFPVDSTPRERNRVLADDFSGMQTFYVVFDAGVKNAYKQAEYLKQLRKVQQYLDDRKKFDKSISLADYISKINQEMKGGDESQFKIPKNNNLVSQYYLFFHRKDVKRYVNSDHSKASILVRHNILGSHLLKQELKDLRRFLKKTSPVEDVRITSDSILVNKASDSIANGQVVSLLILVGIIFLIMCFLFTKIKAGFLSLVPNFFPIVALFGLMGYAGMYLDTATSMIGAIALGIALDDTIHLMVRYNHELNETEDQNRAMNLTIDDEIIPVLSTTIATGLGFGVLIFSSFPPIVRFGMLAALAMLVALLVDMILTPVILRNTRLLTLWDLLSVKVREEVVGECELFEGLSRWSIKKVALMGEIREFSEGEVICSKGDVGEEAYIILDGRVRVTEDEDSDRTINELGPGAFFGEVALISSERRTATITALEETDVLVLKEPDLEKIGRYLPYVSSKINRNIAKIIGRRLSDVL